MSDMDDLLSGDDIDEMMGEISDDPTTIAPLRIPLSEKTRPSLKTPILSGKQMAGQKRPPAVREAVGTQRLFAAKRDEEEARTVELPTQVETVELPTQVQSMDSKNLAQVSVEEIYKSAGLETSDSETFTVYKVESMLQDESIAELDEHSREAAVVMALKTHNVPMAAVIEDAKDRALALDEHDAKFKDELASFEETIRTENERLHAEIERYANPRIERMEQNEQRLEHVRRSYREWFNTKGSEQGNLERMIRRWSDESLQIDTVRLALEIEQSHNAQTAKTSAVTPPPPPGQQSLSAEPPLMLNAPVSPVDPGFMFEDVSIETSDLGAEPLFDLNREQAATLNPASSTDSVLLDDIVKPKTRFPRTILQWFGTLIAFSLWIVAAILIASELQQITALAALFVAFVVPLVVATMMGWLTRGRGFSMGMIAWLGYASVAMIIFAHLSANRLAEAFYGCNPKTQVCQLDYYWIVDETPIFPDPIGSEFKAAVVQYADLLVAQGVAVRPPGLSEAAADEDAAKDDAKDAAKDAKDPAEAKEDANDAAEEAEAPTP